MQDKPTSFSIKDWADDDKPRKKLVLKGYAALSDAELIAILIGYSFLLFAVTFFSFSISVNSLKGAR